MNIENSKIVNSRRDNKKNKRERTLSGVLSFWSDIMIIAKFIIDNIDYSEFVIDYSISPAILDGEGTARTAGYGWSLKRDPNGFIINFNITFGSFEKNDTKLENLWNTIKSLGSKEFISVTAITPDGVIVQNMYANPKELNLKQISRDHKIYWNPWAVAFIAEKGV